MRKAVIIGEKGAYAHLNGQTLVVDRTFYNDLAVDRVVMIEEAAGEVVSIDFKFKNVLFVGAQKIAQELYDAKNWGTPGAASAYNGFLRWVKEHGFKFNVEYNCPA